MRLCLECITATATIYRYQAALPGIKLLVLRDYPLVEATLAEGLAARFFRGAWLPELNNVGHKKEGVSNGDQSNILPRKHTEIILLRRFSSVANWGVLLFF